MPALRIAFIGGTGFIGTRAVERALARGHAVAVLHRGAHPNAHQRAEDVLVDRADAAELKRALAAVAPDVVVDTRAMTRADAAATARGCERLGAALVVLSSQDVYAQFGSLLGHPAPEPEARISESSPLTVPFPYRGVAAHDAGDDYDKKQVEAELRDAVEAKRLPAVTVLRLPATYGPGDPRRRFGALVDALDAGDAPLPREGGSFRWTHGHVTDVAWAISLAAEARLAGYHVFNVGEPDAPTMSEWAERIALQMAKPLRWVESPPPKELSYLGRMANDVVVDTSRIRAALGYAELTSSEQRIADIVAHARSTRTGDATDA